MGELDVTEFDLSPIEAQLRIEMLNRLTID